VRDQNVGPYRTDCRQSGKQSQTPANLRALAFFFGFRSGGVSSVSKDCGFFQGRRLHSNTDQASMRKNALLKDGNKSDRIDARS
jgi:hypothetical protein